MYQRSEKRHAQWELSQQIRLVAVRGEEKEEGRKKGNFVLEKNFCSNLLMFKQLYIDYVLTNRDFFPAAPFVQVHWSVQISSPRSMLWARSVLIALNAIARYKKGRKGSSGTSLFLCPPIRMCLSVFALWTWLHTAHSWQCTVHSWQCTVHSIQLTQSYCRLIQSQLAQPNCTSTENTASSPSSKQTSIKVSGCRTVLRPEHCLLGKGFLVALVAGWESFCLTI